MSLNVRFSRRYHRLLLLLLLLTPGCPRRDTPSTLRVTFLDVGQGDGAVVETSTGETAVIDGGGVPGSDERWGHDPGHRTVVPFLRHEGVRTVDLLVASHPDDDHVQGLIAVVEAFPVRAALVNGEPGTSGAYARLLQRLRARNVPLLVGRRGQAVPLGHARLDILAPGSDPIERLETDNNQSLVLNLRYGRVSVLFTGDAEGPEEDRLLSAHADAHADVLKVGHHGSRHSSSTRFLRAVHPRLAIISVGKHNRYGHPTPEVLARLRTDGIACLRTDQNGAITLETDGVRIRATPTVTLK